MNPFRPDSPSPDASKPASPEPFSFRLPIGIGLLLALSLAGSPASLAQTDPDPSADCGPEAADYRPIHRLEIPLESGFHDNGVPYALDDSALDIPYFDRIAYCLVLSDRDDPDAGARWVYVSAKAFTEELSELGVPAGADAPVHQRLLEDMNVFSNAPGLPTGTAIESGNIEFWPHNYAPANTAGVPGASDGLYDFGDTLTAGVPAGYGSMQIHDHASGITLLAYNGWGIAGRPPELGIGNSPIGHPDWTFEANGGNYENRRLWVFVREAEPPALDIELTSPQSRSVQQRDPEDGAHLVVRGQISGRRAQEFFARGRLWIRAESRDGRGISTNWEAIDGLAPDGSISDTLRLPTGWFDLHYRAELDGQSIAQIETKRVGIGELFLTAGQSNSANHGLPPLIPQDDRVSALGPNGWRQARDPQPIATGAGGTPWPVLGDLLAKALDRPIGFISVGWGGTRVDQWSDPNGILYPRIQQALTALPAADMPELPSLRAVLWHQGESDTVAGTTTGMYAARLGLVIGRSRMDAGTELPWVLARASFLPGTGPGPAVIAGQNQLIAQDPRVFAGPETDDLIGAGWRHDMVHFNEAGLREHARRWADALLAWPELVATPEPSPTPIPSATPTASDTPRPSATLTPTAVPTGVPTDPPAETATAVLTPTGEASPTSSVGETLTPPPTGVPTGESTQTPRPDDLRWTLALPRLMAP